MMRVISLIMVVGFLFIHACSEKFEFKRRFTNYLSDVKNINIDKELLVLSLTGACGYCDEETVLLLTQLDNDQNLLYLEKIIIIPESRKGILTKIKGNKGYSVILEEDYTLSRYGLSFDKSLFLHFTENGRIKYWNWLYMEYFFELRKKYKLH